MSRKDITISIIVGIFTGLVWTGIFVRLGTLDRLGLGDAIWGLVAVVPIVFVFGLYLGQWLSRFAKFFGTFAKFVMVGFMNAGIDLGVFNLLMFWTGIETGLPVPSFKAVAFILALTNSYFWNKYWAFKTPETQNKAGKHGISEQGISPQMTGEIHKSAVEFGKFAAISVGGLFANVGVTSLIVLAIAPKLGFSQLGWNNVAAVFGNIAGLIWNFIGYRWVVFTGNRRNAKEPEDI